MMNIILIIISILCAISFSLFIFLSRSNPYVYEIIFITTLIGISIGILSFVTQKILEKAIENNPFTSIWVAIFTLLSLILALIYFTNSPPKISRSINIKYLVDLNTHELSKELAFQNGSTGGEYLDAYIIFNNFKNKNPLNASKINNIVSSNLIDTTGYAPKLFHNLTEYLVLYFIGYPSITSESELYVYRKEIPNWLGWPDEIVRGDPIKMEDIKGNIGDNIFSRIDGTNTNSKLFGIRVPYNTEISLVNYPENHSTSTYIFKNDYMTITIGIKYLYGHSEYFTRAQVFVLNSPNDLYKQFWKPFKCYTVAIYYDVEFSKLKYGFVNMKYYERWANDLFQLLSRKFAWGFVETTP